MKFRLVIPIILLLFGMFLIFKTPHKEVHKEQTFFKIPDPTIGPGTIIQLLDYGTNMTFAKNFSFDVLYVYTSNVTFENYTSPIIFNSSFIYNNVSIELLEFDIANDNVTINCTKVIDPSNYINFTLQSNKTGYEDYNKLITNCVEGQIENLLVAAPPADTTPPYFWGYNQTKDNTTEYFNFTVNTTGPAWFWWNITDNEAVDFSTCQAKIRNWLRITDQPLLRFINDSYDSRMDSEGWIPYNCTFVEGYDNNKTIRVVVELNHTYEYWSGVFPFEPSLADTYTTYVVHGDNYLMMELHNVTTEPGTRYIISLWAERYSHTANTRDLNVYICNSSYTTGDPLNSPYCFLTHAINKYEQPNGENEFEYLLPFTADDNSFIDGVKVTPTMKIILRADTAQSQVTGWNIYASNISSTHTYMSTDSGDTWTKTQYEANIFLLMANLEQDQHFQINISIQDINGNYNSTNVSTPWSNVNYPPEVAILLDDHPGDLLSIYLYNSTLNITESGLVWINASVYDPDLDNVNCSIYLLNMDMSLNTTFAENQPLNNYYGICYYLLDTNTIPSGTYYVQVNATDGNLTGFDTTDDYVKFAKLYVNNGTAYINISYNVGKQSNTTQQNTQTISTISNIYNATQTFIDKTLSIKNSLASIIEASYKSIRYAIISTISNAYETVSYVTKPIQITRITNRVQSIAQYTNPYTSIITLTQNVREFFNPSQYQYTIVVVSSIAKPIYSASFNMYQDIITTPTTSFNLIYTRIPYTQIILGENIAKFVSFSETPIAVTNIITSMRAIYSATSEFTQSFIITPITRASASMYKDVVSSVIVRPITLVNRILHYDIAQTFKANLYELTRYKPNVFITQTLPTNVISYIKSIRLIPQTVYQTIIVKMSRYIILPIGVNQQINVTTYNLARAGNIKPHFEYFKHYKYYRYIIINNTQNTNTLTDYQIAINITYDGDMNSDFSDLRFTYYNSTDNSEIVIPYWIEQKVNNSWAYVWIRVPYIPASGTSTVYMYYGNTTPITSESNATVVFDLQEDSIAKIRYHGKSGHPSNHEGLLNDYQYNNLEGKELTTSINYGSFGCDYCDFHFTTFMYVEKEGTWYFAIDGDDAVEVEIDGNVVASYYGSHGFCNCYDHNGQIYLSKGWHRLIVRHEEDSGGEGVKLYFKAPGDTSWQVFSTTNLETKAILYGKIAEDNTLKTYEYIENGIPRKYSSIEPTYLIGNEISNQYIGYLQPVYTMLKTSVNNVKTMANILMSVIQSIIAKLTSTIGVERTKIFIYLPKGNVYGYDEEINITLEITDSSLNPLPNRNFDFYIIYPNSTWKKVFTWYTDENGTRRITFTIGDTNPTGNYTLYFNTSTYSYNSTVVEIINPINITDMTPDEWYIDSYHDTESTLTQLLNVTVNRPIINITFDPEHPVSELEPFYYKELNGGYTNCNNKTAGDICYAVVRYLNLAEGTKTLTLNVTVNYQNGGSYSYLYTKNVDISSTLTEIYNTKLGYYESGNFSFTLVNGEHGTCTDSDGDEYRYSYFDNPSNSETITLPDDYDYAIVRVWTDYGRNAIIYYGVNTDSTSSYVSCSAECSESCRASKIFIGRYGDLDNITVKARRSVYGYYSSATVHVYYEIYLFNDTTLRVIKDWDTDFYDYYEFPVTLYTYTPNSTEYGAVYAENVQAYCEDNIDHRGYLYTYFNDIGIASYNGGWTDDKKSMETTIKTVTINRGSENRITIDNDQYNAGEGYYRQGYIVSLLRDLSISCTSNATRPENIRGDPYWNWGYYLLSDSTYVFNCTITNIGLKNHEKGYFVIHAPPGYEFSNTTFEIPPLNVGESTTISFIMKTPTYEIEPLRGFGRDTLWFFANTTDGGYGHLAWWFRLLPQKDVDVILTAPDRVQAGSLFSIDVKFTPHKYSVFYPHIYMNLDGTMGIDVGYSTALLNRTGQGELVVGACFPTLLTQNAYYKDYYPSIRNYLYMYDPYGMLGIPKGSNSYEIGKVSTGYGIIEPGDWGMFGVYDYKINNFVAETGSIFSDWDTVGRQPLYKRLDITEVWQAINIISGTDQPLPKSVVNDVTWTVVHYPLYLYVSGGALYAKTAPDENAVYFMPCLSNSWRVIDPPMNIYVLFVKSGEDAFTLPAGETLSKVDNQVIQPEETAKGLKFKAIAPLKPGIYNITAIVYDDAETGLVWFATKQIRVVSSLPEEKVVISYKDEPLTEIEAKDINESTDILMKRIVYVTNHQGFDDVQVVWRMPPLPEDAQYINGSVEGVIDYLCNNCTVNPSNITFRVPGISMWLDHIAYDSDYVDLEQNMTGSIAIWIRNNATSTDFNNVKVNVTRYLPDEAYSNNSVFYIDTIYHHQRLYYEIPFTVRTGEITYWNLEKPATTYKYTATILMYNNASSNRPIRIHIPLVRLPEFNPSMIRTLTVDGSDNVGYMVTADELIVIVPSDFKDGKSLTAGEHYLYLEYFPYVAGPGPAPGGGVFVQVPTIKIEPEVYNYTGRPGNITIWYKITCKEGCSVTLIPEGPYSTWVHIPREQRYGWTYAGFIYIAPGQTIRQPIYITMPDVADGYYAINISAYDIPTRAKATAKININITRKVPTSTIILAILTVILLAYILKENKRKIFKYFR